MRKIVIDPRVIKHLGRDLITSPEVAVIELVKNSIDAKAKHINLRLYNNYSSNEFIPAHIRATIPEQYLNSPMLIVEDDGCGMTDAVIDNGFLRIATDIKVDEEGSLGEKGIGRLATQRLGSALLVETSSAGARRKILCKRYSTKSRMALESRADSGLNPLFTESHGGQNGMRAGTA